MSMKLPVYIEYADKYIASVFINLLLKCFVSNIRKLLVERYFFLKKKKKRVFSVWSRCLFQYKIGKALFLPRTMQELFSLRKSDACKDAVSFSGLSAFQTKAALSASKGAASPAPASPDFCLLQRSPAAHRSFTFSYA